MTQWKLVSEKTGKPIQIGDELVTFRGEKVKVVRNANESHCDSVWYARRCGGCPVRARLKPR